MQKPVQIRFRSMPASKAIAAKIQRTSQHLEELSARMTSCSVTVERLIRGNQSTRPFRVAIEVDIPGHRLYVNHVPSKISPCTDPYTAIDEAFATMRRVLAKQINAARDKARVIVVPNDKADQATDRAETEDYAEEACI